VVKRYKLKIGRGGGNGGKEGLDPGREKGMLGRAKK